MSGHVWYSFGSDKTGPVLAEALGFDCGKKTPNPDDYEIIVGWGCKPGKKYNADQWSTRIGAGHLRVLNHPAAVEENRNKLRSLKKMCESGISVPGFVGLPTKCNSATGSKAVEEALQRGSIQFPLVAHNSYHKGEPTFCYTMSDVVLALKSCPDREHPLSYFRTLDHGDEFRIHVLRDKVLFAQRKTLSENPVAAATDSLIKKLVKRREQSGKGELHVPELVLAREVIEGLASELLRNASHLKRSTSLGWEFTRCAPEYLPPDSAVMDLAIGALDALDLDMGAVTISYVDGAGRVLSVTTAPALSHPDMAVYVEAIKEFAGSEETAEKKPGATKRAPKASSEVVARIHRKVRELSVEKAQKVLESLEGLEE